ncbi:ATS3 metalloproteinase, partial [Amia calva]|nr:ATS3 metalloproteinase [Amia calva]
DSLQGLLGEYGVVTPISTDADGRFLSRDLSADNGRRRWKRDSTEGPRDRLFYNVTVFGREFHLRLRLNSRLVAPGAKIEWQEDSNRTRSEPLHADCLYVGDVTDMEGATVAISNCDGLVSVNSSSLPVPTLNLLLILVYLFFFFYF